MAKMWAGRSGKETAKAADDFNSSIAVDGRMYRQDIEGSLAHAEMLAGCGIITYGEYGVIAEGLKGILADIESGALALDPDAEDVHMFVEAELTKRVGDAGKKLHTARSRNDQVAVDMRMYLRGESAEVISLIKKLLRAVVKQAKATKNYIVPGYTHLQRAQPIVFAHHLLAYAMMFVRDAGRINDAVRRMNVSPLGSCALAGTTYNTDRTFTAKKLGFDGVCMNSIDGVSDRDFCVELISAFALVMTHLSRFAEEVVLWSSSEFGFAELDDAYTTGSSIMPQKKNSDMAELVRGKTGRVYGDLMAMLTVLKGLPLAYNKDMQEDKECVFDALDTVKACLGIFAPMIDTMKPNKDNMYRAAGKGYINATDLADYLVGKGLPFRTAYKTVGEIVAYGIKHDKTLEEITLGEYKNFSDLFGEDLYEAISLAACVRRRTSEGGTGAASVEKQIRFVEEFVK
ncbi:MAG TPA: argininosuccinate lyase [Candidatus Limadaptatus stercoravium]|nr:argininosuccinate lyase [Candidatus Limadaptatus stercoravium]